MTSLLVGNHDNHRAASRYAPELVDTLNMMIMLLPGTGVSYYGEELGMVDTWVSWEDTKDPQGCNAGPDHYMEASRDPERTPFQWRNAPLAGFTDGNSTWLPVNENYVTLNVDAQEKELLSHLNIYKQILALRNTLTFQKGDLSVRTIGERIFTFRRLYPGEEGLLVVMNLGEEDVKGVNLQSVFDGLPDSAAVRVSSSFSTVKPGHAVETGNLDLLANEGLVLGLIA
ncbi:hypothetical protein J437_LFUL015623 [Ladona fulva]|uniref:Glycosyl hydrolase family 13 catalytic domain-containing protein n=1 Tax=Ladona fulva TaxID=123851 RepID=A0A8K0KK14_LADFU|nr:hypothetical protein J437_LFUL015623 [Ladona fulva]